MDDSCTCIIQVTKNVARYGTLEPALALELKKISQVLSIPGKGILDVHQVPPGQKNQETADVKTTQLNWLKTLLLNPKISSFISGIILSYSDALVDISDESQIVDLFHENNIVAGVCIDKGTVELFGTYNETTTQGLDRLQEKCIELKKNNYHFTSWKCYCKISNSLWPSRLAVMENTNVLARYASIVQSTRMLPIIDFEILSNDDDSINHCQNIHRDILSNLIKSLIDYHVYLDGIIIKISMVQPGSKNAAYVEPEMIAEYTIQTLRQTIPLSVPSIIFKTDNLSIKNYLINLNAICKIQENYFWNFSYCFDNFLFIKMKSYGLFDDNEKTLDDEFFIWMMKHLELCSHASLGKLNIEDLENYILTTNY